MLLREGMHIFRRDPDPNKPFVLDYASASSPKPSYVRVWSELKEIEYCFIGPSSPHTWWGNNPLLTERDIPEPGQWIEVEIGPYAVLRLESNLIYEPNS